MNPMQPLTLVIFGASGDLTFRKLIPAVFDLYCQRFLPQPFAVLGVSRSPLSDEAFRDKVAEGVRKFANKSAADPDKLHDFLQLLHYQSLETERQADYIKLAERLADLRAHQGLGGNVIYYLSTPPSLYDVIPLNLAAFGLNRQEDGWKRLIVEKPFGYSLRTALDLNHKLLSVFEEDQIYRIDHYLGKETVQNLLVTRFSNGIFEPLWNRNYIHHVEITAVEDIGVGDRGGYYEGSGAMRDMVQNHLLQLLGMVAMEPPTVVQSGSIRNEVLKVFQALRPIEDVAAQVVRGQYLESHIRGQQVPGYRREKGVAAESRTETYVAMKFFIDNWRWGGVPFFIRTGKRMPTRVTEIVIHFKETPHRLFADECGMHSQNQLVIRIQPNEGMLLKFGMKIPGAGFQVETVNMDFHYAELGDRYLPSAYERLLLDAMLGDSTLYARGDAVEAAWKFIDPVLEKWQNDPQIPLFGYPSGTWGPEQADQLIGEGLSWRYPCRNLADDGSFCEL
jgi:glucose-6-phosphate 1-dehydrogenase